MADCNICHLYNNAEIVAVGEKYKIIKDDSFYYGIWHECVSWGGVRTCKRNIHDAKFEIENELRDIFKPDFVGMEIIEQPHLHFKCWRIKKGK